MSDDLEKIDLESEDLVDDRLQQLKKLMPEAFSESGIDFDKLRLLLGDEVDEGDERYAFTWPGKADAIRQSQTTSRATLRPCVEKSRSRDGRDGSFDSDNIYIEGDNLEALKLLQRAYHGKVKMIYIDPPYNTGHDFVYKDKFGDTIENYKKQTKQVNQSNPETNGRFHSDWCSMIYPRLKLAKELLTPDGVLFVSIGNQELSNLLSIGDEIFGEGCRLGIIAWESKTKGQNTVTARRQLQPKQEYILVYECNPGRYEFSLETKAEHIYDQLDENGHPYRFKRIEEMSANGERGRSTMVFPILGVMPSEGKQWKLGHETIESYEQRGDLLLRDGKPFFRCRPDDEEDSMLPFWSLVTKEIGTAETAKSALKELMGESGFDTVKPTALLQKLIFHVCGCGDSPTVLDFFSGSSTTAHAVMRHNLKYGTSVKCISIQLPEMCKDDSVASRAGYSTVCDIGEMRIRRAGNKIAEKVAESNKQLKLGEEPKQLPDIGFRVFELDGSGIAEPENGQLLVDRRKADRSDLDIIFEVMLKWGYELTYPIEKVEFAGYGCYSVAAGDLICCMEPGLTVDALEAIAAEQPRRVFIMDCVFRHDDSLKLDALAIFRHAEEKTQQKIELRTV